MYAGGGQPRLRQINGAVARLQQKSPLARAFSYLPFDLVERADVRRLIAFGAGRDVVGDFLVFTQAFETIALDRREMRKEVFAAIVRRNETKTFGVVEPLNSTVTHLFFPDD